MKAVRLLLILLFVIPKHVIAEENSNQLLLTQSCYQKVGIYL